MECEYEKRKKCDSLYIEKYNRLLKKLDQLKKEKEEMEQNYKNIIQETKKLINTHKFKDKYDRQLLKSLGEDIEV